MKKTRFRIDFILLALALISYTLSLYTYPSFFKFLAILTLIVEIGHVIIKAM